jgi:hypothetical protein
VISPITIASNLPGTAQSYTWTPTAAQATDQARVRVEAFDAAISGTLVSQIAS